MNIDRITIQQERTITKMLQSICKIKFPLSPSVFLSCGLPDDRVDKPRDTLLVSRSMTRFLFYFKINRLTRAVLYLYTGSYFKSCGKKVGSHGLPARKVGGSRSKP